jgi:phenylacetate-CoA ligase
MSDLYEPREALTPHEREADFFRLFALFLADALEEAPGLARHLGGVDPAAIASRQALAALPVLRKGALMRMQAEDPPFGGLVPADALQGTRVFMSPGPVWEPQGPGVDPWGAARAFYAAGFRPGDMVVNTYAYHMTPAGFIMDEGARALGCTVFPAGPGNSEAQAAAIAALKPIGYMGTPDFLKVILDKAAETGHDVSSLKRAHVSAGALFPSLREEYAARGIPTLQAYATADLGVVAYETMHAGALCEGMVVNEDILVEIVRPGTGDPVPEGEVGEIVVTTLNRGYPLVRFGTGDLSAVIPGASPCGRTNMRLKGWMGRADQRTKVKGMFVDPAQIAAIRERHPEILRARLEVTREGEMDATCLRVEAEPDAVDTARLAQDFQQTTGLRLGRAEIVPPSTLPNDGKVIDDQRRYDTAPA